MARTVGVRELRQNLSKYLRRVKDGESLTVTERGREVARVVPLAGNEFRQMLAELHGISIPPGTGKLSDTIKRLESEGRFDQASPAGSTDAFLDESRKELG
ncbi:MAG TPA: type II toxin-antitoxin system prevent-host-death family antitoxin [Solirubrobacterales bacterium]|jgi:prevent-host-death family protein|nr:type II toxin-antitoxin system prevent-host-death family antitoxin [Solirubrobacterales bacterium]